MRKHPNYHLIPEGGAPAYEHGKITKATAFISFDGDLSACAESMEIPEDLECEILTEEELEQRFSA